MKSNIQDIATIVATVVWSDGEFAEAEKTVVSEVAKAINADVISFVKSVEKLSAEFNGIDEDSINKKLQSASKNIDKKEITGVLAICIQVIMADGFVGHEEVANFLAIAESLGADETDAVLILADAIKGENDIQIDLD